MLPMPHCESSKSSERRRWIRRSDGGIVPARSRACGVVYLSFCMCVCVPALRLMLHEPESPAAADLWACQRESRPPAHASQPKSRSGTNRPSQGCRGRDEREEEDYTGVWGVCL